MDRDRGLRAGRARVGSSAGDTHSCAGRACGHRPGSESPSRLRRSRPCGRLGHRGLPSILPGDELTARLSEVKVPAGVGAAGRAGLQHTEGSQSPQGEGPDEPHRPEARAAGEPLGSQLLGLSVLADQPEAGSSGSSPRPCWGLPRARPGRPRVLCTGLRVSAVAQAPRGPRGALRLEPPQAGGEAARVGRATVTGTLAPVLSVGLFPTLVTCDPGAGGTREGPRSSLCAAPSPPQPAPSIPPPAEKTGPAPSPSLPSC